MSSHEVALKQAQVGEEEDEKAFEEYYENDYGKRKLEWLKSVAEARGRETRKRAEALTPQVR